MGLKIFADGSISRGYWGSKETKHLPALCWAGWVVYRDTGEWLAHHSVALGEVPNASANFSEYAAVSSVLRWLGNHGHTDQALTIHSDSQIIIRQLSGEYQCHDPRLKALRDHVRELARRFPKVSYVWIRREQNKYADVMSKALQDGGVGIPETELSEEVLRKRK